MRTGLNNRLGSAEHTVYRLYDQQDRLIYVGCTHDLVSRLKTHQKTAWWYPQIARISTQQHQGRGAALKAETLIRNTQHPRWNIEARWMQREHWNRQMLADYITALENHQGNKYASIKARIQQAKAFQVERYGTSHPQGG